MSNGLGNFQCRLLKKISQARRAKFGERGVLLVRWSEPGKRNEAYEAFFWQPYQADGMPIFRLVDEPIFPPPDYADPSGLLAVGGDLSSERLLEAYRLGIFPWYSDDQPILWWSPDPRFVLRLEEFHISRSLRKTLRQSIFQVTIDRAFDEVIAACAEVPRAGQNGTWITPEMQEAYSNLHGLGYAHSVETWFDGKLAGGIYGVSLGKAFFGESMFHRKTNASKVALAALVEKLKRWSFHFLDAQMTTEHMMSLGATEVSRRIFLKQLRLALEHPTRRGKWRIED